MKSLWRALIRAHTPFRPWEGSRFLRFSPSVTSAMSPYLHPSTSRETSSAFCVMMTDDDLTTGVHVFNSFSEEEEEKRKSSKARIPSRIPDLSRTIRSYPFRPPQSPGNDPLSSPSSPSSPRSLHCRHCALPLNFPGNVGRARAETRSPVPFPCFRTQEEEV